MKIIWLPVSFILVILTGSCENHAASSINVYQMSPSDYEVLLYSNQEDIDLEKDYINALLELKLSYPEELNNLALTKTALTENKKGHPGIANYPALVIQKNGKILASLTGEMKKDEIYKVLQSTIYIERK